MLYTGEVINGKWNKNRYIILKKLGQGGVGSIYKVKDRFGNIRAIKISSDMNSITREYETMKRFKNIRIVPNIYEMDDYKKYGETFHFFTLDYIEGYNLKQIMNVREVSLKDIISISIVILKNLKVIYDFGYIYSDIKLENIMIDKNDKNIYLIDFGGTIDKSLGFKEYTPTYNIVSWGVESKPDYSTSMIFSVNMLLTSVILRNEPSPLVKNLKHVSAELKEKSISGRLKRTMTDALNGNYNDVDKYISDLQAMLKGSKNLCPIDFIFKGSILLLVTVITINAIINWM